MAIKWGHPFTAILAGPTSCGKSSFIKNFLANINLLVDTKLHEIIYCLPDDQPIDQYLTSTSKDEISDKAEKLNNEANPDIMSTSSSKDDVSDVSLEQHRK